MITIVDYGMGNLGSVLNMLNKIGVKATISSSHDEILNAGKLILPGVGAFDAAMTRIQDAGLGVILEKRAMGDRIPILGICLGMQILTRGSEEGKLPGFGWIPAQAKRFPVQPDLKVPHMGWNIVYPSNASRLTENCEKEARFYFVHSYAVFVDKAENSILKTEYGIEFDSAIQCDNIYGVQFHPEKSHRFGMQVLKNFASL